VLSAYGMGLADVRALRQRAIEARLSADALAVAEAAYAELGAAARAEIEAQGIAGERVALRRTLHLKYDGTDTTLEIEEPADAAPFPERSATLTATFEREYRSRYGFLMPGRHLVIEAAGVEAIGGTESPDERPPAFLHRDGPPQPLRTLSMYTEGAFHDTPVFDRDTLVAGDRIAGPAILKERNATTVIEPGWEALLTPRDHLVLTRVVAKRREHAIGTHADPVLLEVFNNLFMSIAEQMGVTLQNTSYSVNIKERLDFSCAIFDGDGLLTMEEILTLKLDADWVVLSACNTGTGSGAGAEAASGLGRPKPWAASAIR